MNNYYPPPRRRRGGMWLLLAVIIIVVIIYANSKGIINLNNLNPGNFSLSSGNQTQNPQNISINGMNQVQTIDYPNQNITLIINGQYNNITVTKATLIYQINLNGIDNTVNLCRGISPQVNDNGQGNQVNYKNC